VPDRTRVSDHPLTKRDEATEGQTTARQFFEKPGVLVVDDDHLERVQLRLGLERTGFNVWSAADGCEALHLYQEHGHRIAVVLLDFRMPGLEAFATLDALRELNLQLRICFMIGDTHVCDSQALIQRGASHVIVKPFLVNDLVSLLRPWARGVPVGPIPVGNV
jgi:CheY-like chemotaxis protein